MSRKSFALFRVRTPSNVTWHEIGSFIWFFLWSTILGGQHFQDKLKLLSKNCQNRNKKNVTSTNVQLHRQQVSCQGFDRLFPTQILKNMPFSHSLKRLLDSSAWLSNISSNFLLLHLKGNEPSNVAHLKDVGDTLSVRVQFPLVS